MKVAIGMKLRRGPFGGGNQFGNALKSYLESRGDTVVDNLDDPDIDIIMMTDPRTSLLSCAFGPVEILDYLQRKPDTIVVHRINECDERKGTTLVNRILARSNSIADHTVYIATWLIDLFKNQGLEFTENYSVVLNGAEPKHFYPDSGKPEELSQPVRLVTHHWGGFWEKGWDIYLKLDKLISADKYRGKLEFHYIGNPLDGIRTENIIFHPPASGKELGELLNKNDIYVTGSMNEPAGMHHIEGALCGLPLLYRNSGALPEFCRGYGVMFNGVDDFESALDELIENYAFYKKKIKEYDNTCEKMCSGYYDVFVDLLNRKEEIISVRKRIIFPALKKLGFRFMNLKYRVMTRLGVR